MNFYFKQLNADAQENAGATEPVEEASAATTNAPEAPAKAPVAEVVETAHDDFDWSVDKRNVSSYSKEEKEKYD